MSTNPLDYTSVEFDSIKADVISYIQTNYPTKWTDLSNSNTGVILIDVIAFVFDRLSWCENKTANELFVPTVELKSSILKLAQPFGYQPGGVTAATILVDVTLATPITGSQPAVMAEGLGVTSTTGVPFETYESVLIQPGYTYPTTFIASELNSTPVGSLVNFISNSALISFSNPGGISTYFNSAVLPGMWIQSTSGPFQQWSRIISVSADYSQLTLDQAWNSVFNGPFMIRTQGNDTPSSTILIASTPYGSFSSNATATVASNAVTFTVKLPNNVFPGQWFRFNNPDFCETNAFFQIATISQDRLSLTIVATNGYGPIDVGGFDSLNSTFQIQSRSALLIQGQSHTEQFISTTQPLQTYQLSSTSIISNSIEVYDQDGVVDSQGNPLAWNQVAELSLAIGSSIRSYSYTLLDNDQYVINFGDGTNGQIPQGLITIDYRIGGGVIGNIPANTIKSSVPVSSGTNTVIAQLTNPATTGQGGSAGESVQDIQNNIPAFVRTNMRAVTDSDYQDLIINEYPKSLNPVGTVYVATVNQLPNQIPFGGNSILVYCWTRVVWRPPSSNSPSSVQYYAYSPINTGLLTAVQAYIEQFCMITDAPSIIKGIVDPAFVDLDIQIDPTGDVSTVSQSVEAAIVALFNSTSTINRQPVLLSDLYGAVTAVALVTQVRVRQMFLDYVDPNDPNIGDILTDTPAGLYDVTDLYPRDVTHIVVPGDINIETWNQNIGLSLYINGTLLLTENPSTDELAREGIRKALEDYFFSLRPSQGVTIADINAVLAATQAGSVNVFGNIRVASTVGIDILNVAASTSLVIDGVSLAVGDNFLLKNQASANENGFYTVTTLDGVNPWIIARMTSANSYYTLTPGSYCVILAGTVNAGTSWYMSTLNLNYNTFASQNKTFVSGTRDQAEALIQAISNFTVKFDSPIGNTVTSKPGLTNVIYYAQVIMINGSSA